MVFRLGASVIVIAASSAAFEAQQFPETQERVITACGWSPTIEVNWDSFGGDQSGEEAFKSGGLKFLGESLAIICKDETAKAQFKQQVGGVRLSQAHGAADPIVYLYKRQLRIEYLWNGESSTPDPKLLASEIGARLRGEEMEAP